MINLDIDTFTITNQLKETVTVSRQNKENRNQLDIISGSIEMIILPLEVVNPIQATGQLISVGPNYEGYLLSPNSDIKKGDVVIRRNARLPRLFINEVSHVLNVMKLDLTPTVR